MGGGNSRQKKVVTLIQNLESSKLSVSKVHLERKVTWSGFRRIIDTVFPELIGQPLTVTWNSPDKRTCKVSSDDELIVAVESMGDKIEFNIKRMKAGEDQTDKKKDKETTSRRVSIRDNPTVARLVKPLTKIFSQKEIKPPDQTNKQSDQSKSKTEQIKTKPDQSKAKPDQTKTKPDQTKTKPDENNKQSDQSKKSSTKK